MPAILLHVPIKSANGAWSARSWPSELRILAEKLLSTRVILSAVLADTESAWVRPNAPESPGPGTTPDSCVIRVTSSVTPSSSATGTCVVANRSGVIDVAHQWFADVQPGDTEAVAYPIVHIYVTLCISNLRPAAAREIANRLNLLPGQYVVIEESAIVGAILSAWGNSHGSDMHYSLGWGADRTIQKTWFAEDAALPMIFETMRLSACMRALRRVDERVIERGSMDAAYAVA